MITRAHHHYTSSLVDDQRPQRLHENQSFVVSLSEELSLQHLTFRLSENEHLPRHPRALDLPSTFRHTRGFAPQAWRPLYTVSRQLQLPVHALRRHMLVGEGPPHHEVQRHEVEHDERAAVGDAPDLL
eukprot:1178277-Prorocentrum_minimum.AAC.3